MVSTRTALFLLASGAAAFAGCGYSTTPTPAGPVRSEERFIIEVRRAVPVAHLDGISDAQLITIGNSACTRVADGETSADVYDSMYANAETEGQIAGADALVEIARIGLARLCPGVV